MSEHCTCCSHDTVTGLRLGGKASAARVQPAETVAAVGARSARAVDVMKGLGINHCCGGHLSLAEAAALAGVPLDTLLAALDDAIAQVPA